MSTQPIYGIPSNVEHWAIAISATAAACSLFFCVQRAVSLRSPVPLYLFAAGALVVFVTSLTAESRQLLLRQLALPDGPVQPGGRYARR